MRKHGYEVDYLQVGGVVARCSDTGMIDFNSFADFFLYPKVAAFETIQDKLTTVEIVHTPNKNSIEAHSNSASRSTQASSEK